MQFLNMNRNDLFLKKARFYFLDCGSRAWPHHAELYGRQAHLPDGSLNVQSPQAPEYRMSVGHESRSYSDEEAIADHSIDLASYL